jgi:hypothetical protein
MIPDIFGSMRSKEARAGRILAALSPAEREALFRFYTLGETTAQISQRLEMTENQFRELKERVRINFQLGERVQ